MPREVGDQRPQSLNAVLDQLKKLIPLSNEAGRCRWLNRIGISRGPREPMNLMKVTAGIVSVITDTCGTMVDGFGILCCYLFQLGVMILSNPQADCGRPVSFTAVVNSIVRSTENRTPNRCLPFDGVWHRGVEWRHYRKLESGPCTRRHPGCRAPIPSQGKQQFGALFSVERSIELTAAGLRQLAQAHICTQILWRCG